jgi:hypothetical protein
MSASLNAILLSPANAVAALRAIPANRPRKETFMLDFIITGFFMVNFLV